MKKVLTIAVVALLATATLFAGVNFGGTVDVGYVFNWNKDGDFDVFQYGNDGDDTGEANIGLSISDDNGFWSVGIDYIPRYNSDGKVNAEVDLNLGAIIEALAQVDLPITWQFGLGFNGREAGLRAYKNVSGNNLDRIRSAEGGQKGRTYDEDAGEYTGSGWGTFFHTAVGYENLVTVSFAYDPVETESLVIGALVAPINGLKVSADYVKNGQADKGVSGSPTADNLASVAADVNVATLVGLGFDLGVSASYLWAEDAINQVAAVVYGGVDLVSGYVEYAVEIEDKKDPDSIHYLEVGADLNVVDDLALDAYFGCQNLEEFEDNWYIGANIGYNLAGIGLNLNVEYAEGTRFADIGANQGFSITPSISLTF